MIATNYYLLDSSGTATGYTPTSVSTPIIESSADGTTHVAMPVRQPPPRIGGKHSKGWHPKKKRNR